jgi:integrase
MPTLRITKSNVDKKAVHDPENGVAASFFFDPDLRGFGLKVTPAGHKSYFVQYRNGKGRKAEKVRHVIGEHGAPWTPDTAREEADRILAKAKLGESTVHAAREDKAALTVAELCEQYLRAAEAGVPMKRGSKLRVKKAITVRYDRGRIARHIVPLLGKKAVTKITGVDIRKFVDDLILGKTAVEEERTETNGVRKQGRLKVEGGPGAARRALELLGGIFEYGKDRGLCADNPVRGVAKPASKGKDRWLNADEFKRLGRALAAAETDGINQKWIDAIKLAAFTGARRKDIQALEWADVDIDGQTLRLGDSKIGKNMRPLGKAAADILRRRAAKKASDVFVFPADRGSDRPMDGINGAFKKILKGAGINDVSPHTLRHTLCTHANDMGFSEPVIAAIVGHKRHTTTSRYTHHIDRTLITAADKISDRIARMMDGRPLEDSAEVVDLQQRRA